MDLIHKHKKQWTTDELSLQTEKYLNRKISKKYEMNFYEHKDASEIISQLIKRNLIKVCGFPFKGLITTI